MWGEPIYVPREAGRDRIEDARRELEVALMELTKRVEGICGGSFTIS